ncbi:hypothetical protein MMAD_56400 (plasmid) [Mycolicibacterium madagascariense]|uniref:Uncharacterized protein n=1 Tax=Mycolicibacterium madagascariense TaxID=212765 RepID=A0A7I7XQ77_9MYCO|nr:hypothetical protein [Mycolicibacterium madagascariense]BBZ31345.1 hypothetical protein MMAD_56400 [Mycolicibacterium madagascariense]
MAFQTNSAKMREAAQRLDDIKTETLNSLGRYMSMNQDLGGSAFQGLASFASMKTTEDVATTGRNVSARFEQVIQALRSGADEYDRVEHENQTSLSSVQAT